MSAAAANGCTQDQIYGRNGTCFSYTTTGVAGQAAYDDVSTAINEGFVLYGAALVFFMQAGFTMLEAGSVRVKNLKHILLKNVLDTVVAAIMWWALGWGLAYGDSSKTNLFWGVGNFFHDGVGVLSGAEGPGATTNWLFQYGFCASAVTIISGAIAERVRFPVYFTMCVVLSGFAYPVQAHWVWSGSGWLTDTDTLTWSTNGFIDFAGSGVVHMFGGTVALCGAFLAGPRTGRFDDSGMPRRLPGYSGVFVAIGVLILWTGWFGFNAASALGLSGSNKELAAVAARNTAIASASGGIAVYVLLVVWKRQYNIEYTLNGCLGGLVGITAPCAFVDSWAAFVIGIIAGLVSYFTSEGLLKLHIDDPLNAVPVHFCCGVWGVLANGLFASHELTSTFLGFDTQQYGLFVGGGGAQLATQIVGTLALIAWDAAFGLVLFGVPKYLGWLRVTEAVEANGVDSRGHGACSWARVEMIEEGVTTEYQFRIQ